MSSQEDEAGAASSSLTSTTEEVITVTIGATVPTGFEFTAAEEVQEKLGVGARIGKNRGRIYFPITSEQLKQVHLLRSVDNLFVVVKQYDEYPFKESKTEALKDLQELSTVLSWTDALKIWKLNGTRRKRRVKTENTSKKSKSEASDAAVAEPELEELEELDQAAPSTETKTETETETETETVTPDAGTSPQDSEEAAPKTKVTRFRVTCNRVGNNHSFSSNDAARDFGGAVQELFQWKADMTNFDIEVLLNIHFQELTVGIALTEESLHRRNISHFGPTTLRSTLCYGMLRLCKPQVSDIVLDPMCGSGAIPLEGAIELNNSFYIAGDNFALAAKRTMSNIWNIQNRRAHEGRAPGLPIDALHWDLCNLPMRTSSVDIIVTDMPFGKRIGSKKVNRELYPSCLREMARVCRPETGKAVLLTQDKKCFANAIFTMSNLWSKQRYLKVNVGGLHAAVYVLQRTAALFFQTRKEPEGAVGTEAEVIPQDEEVS